MAVASSATPRNAPPIPIARAPAPVKSRLWAMAAPEARPNADTIAAITIFRIAFIATSWPALGLVLFCLRGLLRAQDLFVPFLVPSHPVALLLVRTRGKTPLR